MHERRMSNPATLLPDVATGVQHLFKAMYRGGVAPQTLELVHLRISQINGCSACVDAGIESARKGGVTDDQLNTLTAWREAPYFDDALGAALELAEAGTRMADQPDAVPDAVWNAAAAHYDETQLAALVIMVATTNLFNRLNRMVREPAGVRWG